MHVETNRWRTFTDVVRERSMVQADQLACRFLVDGETQADDLTYAELDRRARAIGALLQQAGAGGERALLVYPPGLEYAAAFLGCLYAGTTAVPIYPPKMNRPDERFMAVVQDAGARTILTTAAIASKVAARGVEAEPQPWSHLQWLSTDDLDDGAAGAWVMPNISGETVAFLQYTSGSTSTPKGVIVTHSNLLANERTIQGAYGVPNPTASISWLPQYHDMGLIGGLLQPIYCGYLTVMLSPLAFIQRPLRWLQAIARYKAHVSTAPNFAYDLCVQKVKPEQVAELDLSSWQIAINGAEPVRLETMERFARLLEPAGFKPQVFYPSYGLAEATLLVAASRRTGAPIASWLDRGALEGEHRVVEAPPASDESIAFVSCGQPAPDCNVIIADPETGTLAPPDRVGEIWVAGPGIARGYWNRPAETAATFDARLADGSGPFMRTGDLGFRRDGELYVTGRLKDLIIIRGQNHYPQDIEFTVRECHPALRPDGTAAFTITEDGEERLVVAAEVERTYLTKDLQGVATAIRTAVSDRHQLQVHGVAILMPGSMPKTSSGKIRRSTCRMQYLADQLEAPYIMVNGQPVAATRREPLARQTAQKEAL